MLESFGGFTRILRYLGNVCKWREEQWKCRGWPWSVGGGLAVQLQHHYHCPFSPWTFWPLVTQSTLQRMVKLTFTALGQEGQGLSPQRTWKNWDIQQQNNFAEQSCGKSKEKGMKNFTLNLVMGYYLPLLKENKYISLDDISPDLQILFCCLLCLLSLTKVKGSQWTFWENTGQERNGAGWH